jgi:glutathione S-transferase
MKLLMNAGSPFARKVRILARESGMAGRITEVPVKVSPVEADADLVQANPLGQIPVLVLDDGSALYDSNVICDYLEALAPSGVGLPHGGPDRIVELRSRALCEGMLQAAIQWRYELAVRPAALRWDAWVAGQRRKIAAGLATLDATCAGWQEQFGRTQVSAVCVLGYLDFRFPDWTWRQDHPRLASWFLQISKRPSVLDTLPSA